MVVTAAEPSVYQGDLETVGVLGLLALSCSVAHRGAGVTVWKLAPVLLFTGIGSGLVFVQLVDFILGNATTEEVGTGAGMLNAVQQFAGAIGVAALGRVFLARVGRYTARCDCAGQARELTQTE